MATTPTIVVGRNNWGIKNGNLLGYYQSDDGFFVKREFAATRGGGTNGTFVGSNGFIQTAASGNLPRIDFYGGSPALLVEPAATNLALQSQDLTAGSWTPTTATINPNAATAPDGTLTADTLTATAINGQIQQVYVGTSGTTYTVSFYIKRRTGTGVVNIRAVENVDTPVTVTNNWTRVSFSATATTTTVRIGIRLATSGDEVDLWGAQVEAGSVATSYIPTTTGSVTRNADVINLTGATDYIGQTEGTLYAEVDFRNLGYNGAILTLQTDNWITNSIQIQKSLGNQWRFTIRAASAVILNVDVGTITAGIYKIALGYNTVTSGTVLAVNGSILSTQTASSIPACNSVVLGTRNETGTFTIHLNDRIRSAAVYNERLSNQELIEITS